jgi:NADP-dependent 3-hydroxy acid dehydrogenase YdfG
VETHLGIGLAIAHYLLKQKCRVVTVARSKEPMQALSRQYPGQVEVLAGDVSDLSLGKKAADLAQSKWQRLDGVIVNHGILDPVKRIANVEAEEWRQLFDVNVFSAVALVSVGFSFSLCD